MSIRIIYIDDELGLCQMFEDNFSSDEILVETYTDPMEGIAAVNRNPPDLVLLDYRLPNCLGDRLAEKIPDHIKVALITGDLHIQVSSRIMRTFRKPFDFSEMEKFFSEISRH